MNRELQSRPNPTTNRSPKTTLLLIYPLTVFSLSITYLDHKPDVNQSCQVWNLPKIVRAIIQYGCYIMAIACDLHPQRLSKMFFQQLTPNFFFFFFSFSNIFPKLSHHQSCLLHFLCALHCGATVNINSTFKSKAVIRCIVTFSPLGKAELVCLLIGPRLCITLKYPNHD